MHCVTWTYEFSAEFSKADVEKQFNEVRHIYLGVPGLIRKYFGFSEDAKKVIGIYLWTSKAAAEAFYTPDWMAGVTKRWGVTPTKDEWVVPTVAENEVRI